MDTVIEIFEEKDLQQLGQEYLPTVKDVYRRLPSDPSARVADIGCGLGWSSIGMARAYPKIRVDGYDLDTAMLALNAVQAEKYQL